MDPRAFASFLAEHLREPRENVTAFGEELKALLRAGHVTLVGSGSSANLVAALAIAERCGLAVGKPPPKRRKVLVAGFTFPTTVTAFRLAGFDVRAVDTEPGEFGMCPDALASSLDEDVAALCVTHFLGFPARIDVIADVAASKGVSWILQDGCETLNLRVGDYPIVQWSAVSTFAFDYRNHLFAYGGGAVVTHDTQLAHAIESIVHYGRECTHHYDEDACQAPPLPDHPYWFTREGVHVSMSELNACHGLFSLESYVSDQRRRALHYGIFYEALAGHPKVSVHADPFRGVAPFAFPVRMRKGEARPLAERLLERGVEVRSLMGGAITDQPAFSAIPSDGLEACKATAAASFLLDVHAGLSTDRVEEMAKIVAEEAAK